MRALASALVLILAALMWPGAVLWAQTSVDFPPDGPSRVAWEWRIEPQTGSPQYLCTARGSNSLHVFAITPSQSSGVDYNGAVTNLTQIVVVGNVATATLSQASGLDIGHRVQVTGASVSALNSTWTVTSTDPTSATLVFSVSGVTAGTYNNAGLRILTNSPRTNAEVWAVQRIFYNGTVPVRMAWARSATSTTLSCANRAAYWQ